MLSLKITAWMGSPVAGDAPCLDSLLEYEASQAMGIADGPRRCDAIPAEGEIAIPIERAMIGGRLVPRCSSPILNPSKEWAEHVAKRLSVENADMLSEKKRLVVSTGRHEFKSYRMPLRLRQAERIVWFCVGDRDAIISILSPITSIGKKRSVGYGRILQWTADVISEDVSWFAPSPAGPVLMRPLPDCNELPSDLIGARKNYGACTPPYWHSDRYTEIVVPC